MTDKMQEMHRKIDDAANALLEYHYRLHDFAHGSPSHSASNLLRRIATAALTRRDREASDVSQLYHLIGMVDAAREIFGLHVAELSRLDTSLKAAVNASIT